MVANFREHVTDVTYASITTMRRRLYSFETLSESFCSHSQRQHEFEFNGGIVLT